MKSIYSVKVKKNQVFMKAGQNEQRIRVWEGVPSSIAKGTDTAELRVAKLRVNFTDLQIPS